MANGEEKLDLNNLTVNKETLFEINNYYIFSSSLENNFPLPTEIYIFLLHISHEKINFWDIEDGRIKDLLNMENEMIVADSNNLEVLTYALDNNLIKINNAFTTICGYGKLDLLKYLLLLIDDDNKKRGLRIALHNINIPIINFMLTEYKDNKDELSKFLYNFATDRWATMDNSALNLENIEIINLLIENGADINFGNDILLKKALESYEPDYDFIKYLLNLGANPNSLSTGRINKLNKYNRYDILDLLEDHSEYQTFYIKIK